MMSRERGNFSGGTMLNSFLSHYKRGARLQGGYKRPGIFCPVLKHCRNRTKPSGVKPAGLTLSFLTGLGNRFSAGLRAAPAKRRQAQHKISPLCLLSICAKRQRTDRRQRRESLPQGSEAARMVSGVGDRSCRDRDTGRQRRGERSGAEKAGRMRKAREGTARRLALCSAQRLCATSTGPVR